jgi:hypothetical protein
MASPRFRDAQWCSGFVLARGSGPFPLDNIGKSEEPESTTQPDRLRESMVADSAV